MDWGPVISTILGVYASVLSTWLAIRGWKKDRRNLLIILEYIPFYERVNFRFVNAGVRPITVVNIGLSAYETNDGVNPPHWEEVPAKYLVPEKYKDGTLVLPVLIKDGEQAVIPISERIGNILITNKVRDVVRAKIFVHDAEGNVYTKFKTIETNPKFDILPPFMQ